MSVVDAETFGFALGLRVHKRVDAFHCFGKVATHMTHDLEKFILIETFGDPKGEVLIASGELRIGLELCDLTLLELADEAGIGTPEQTYVLDVKEFHSPTLETEAESPTDLLIDVLSTVGHDSVMDDAGAEDLQPLVVIVYL